ncbi:peptidase S8/S53 domain-containing protein [Dimargaris cristalligena]|uniref:Peptidase S8/S53 domain-containing protein n=1 Tax=Dimargaris cristalligena TaxID=215637 RepID=A0A4P9ZQQ0_9FUNG|nr:peptidase S8/S53 domain-containing protein [Dimargaris cristalligena]|eukprot:RKP35448.1 peptidase S8/S53 domain-containing protein [Dimargaris cristalligena]
MVRLISVWGALAAALVSNLPLSVGQGNSNTHITPDTIPHQYIVTFPGAPGTPAGAAGAQTFYNQMAALGIPFTVVMNYTVIMNGMSISVDDSYSDTVNSLSGVTYAWQLSASSIDQSTFAAAGVLPRLPPKPMLAHNYTGVDHVHNQLGKTGANVKIGILDAGVDYTHPAFGNCYKTPGCRIQYGWDFIGDNGNSYGGFPDDNPIEVCTQHGTHVAGIVAGNDGHYKGVAPGATLGIYRVLNCRLLTYENFVIKAMEQSFIDGMDIITMSLGFPGKWSESGISVAASNLARLGVLMVAAAGNRGAEGMWAVDGPSISPHCVSVGSADFPIYYSQYMNVTSNENVAIRRTMNPINIETPTLNNVQIVRGFTVGSTTDDFGCAPLPDYTGKVVLLQIGGCMMDIKASNAQAAGAVQMVVYQTSDDTLYRPEYTNYLTVFPVVSIFKTDATYLINKIATTTVRISSKSDSIVFDAITPRAPSSFSSWGPGPTSEVKPDLLGPGVNIYAPYPTYAGYYGHMTGTSMSTPYVAGVAALAMENGKSNANNGTISAVVNTARPQMHPTVLRPYSVARQGAGIVNAFGATASQAIFNFTSVNGTFPDTDWRDFDVFFGFTNIGTTPIEMNITSVNTISSSGFDAQKYLVIPPRDNAKIPAIWFNKRQVTAAAGKLGVFNINLDHSSHVREDLFLYSAYLTLFPTAGVSMGFNYTLPILGFSYKSTQVPVLPPLASGLPCLVFNVQKQCLSTLNTFTPAIRAGVLFRLQHPARRLRVTLAKAATPTVDYGVIDENIIYFARNYMNAGSYNYTYGWGGDVFITPTQKIVAPEDDYVVKLNVYTYDIDLAPVTWTSIPLRWRLA